MSLRDLSAEEVEMVLDISRTMFLAGYKAGEQHGVNMPGMSVDQASKLAADMMIGGFREMMKRESAGAAK